MLNQSKAERQSMKIKVAPKDFPGLTQAGCINLVLKALLHNAKLYKRPKRRADIAAQLRKVGEEWDQTQGPLDLRSFLELAASVGAI